MASPRDSPVSDVPSDKVLGSLSVRDKSLLKRNINRHHNNNIGAGYVPVHEDDLHKTGLRGRKMYLFSAVLFILSILAIANLILLLIIFSILRIGLGMESLEVIPEHSLIKFYGRTDLGLIFKRDGVLEGFSDERLLITGDESQLLFDIISSRHEARRRVMSLSENEAQFDNVLLFEVKHPKTSEDIFSTNNPSFKLRKAVKSLHADFAITARILGRMDKDLVLRSDSVIRFKGNEGTIIEGKQIFWSADQYLLLKSFNGSIIVIGKGVGVDFFQLPFAPDESFNGPAASQYKICVCMPSGRLFKVKVNPGHGSNTACSKVNTLMHSDPCMFS